MALDFDTFESGGVRRIVLFTGGAGLGAAVSLLYDGPFEVGLGPAVAFLAIALVELSHRKG